MEHPTTHPTTTRDDALDAAGLDVLYDEAPCLAIAKPPGLLTQSPPGIDSVEVRVKAYLNARRPAAGSDNPAPGDVYLGVPHRLDRPASGVLLLGTTRRATRRLAEQFEARSVEKVYWALVEGEVQPAAGTWEDFVRKIPGQPHAETVAPGHPEGRLAVLHYRVLAAGPWGTWLAVALETGRTHQIRVQAASRGHPVHGDEQYGSTAAFGPPQDDWRLRPIALHARSLRFEHPTSRQVVTIEAPTDENWREVVDVKPQAE